MTQPNPETDKHGARRWYVGDRLHRIDGPAVEYACGTRCWFRYDHLHRMDGPAVEYPCGGRVWYQFGNRHRIDGPAIVDADGNSWYIRGIEYTEEQFRLLKFVDCEFNGTRLTTT